MDYANSSAGPPRTGRSSASSRADTSEPLAATPKIATAAKIVGRPTVSRLCPGHVPEADLGLDDLPEAIVEVGAGRTGGVRRSGQSVHVDGERGVGPVVDEFPV